MYLLFFILNEYSSTPDENEILSYLGKTLENKNDYRYTTTTTTTHRWKKRAALISMVILNRHCILNYNYYTS